MTTPTQPAIIGSGNIGSALATLFARAGLEVSIANTRGPESLSELASSIGPGVHAVTVQLALASDVIFMAIPFGAVEQFGKSLPDWNGKTVIDTTNAHYTTNRDTILNGRTSTQHVAEHLPGAKIVKAFNQLPANTLQAALAPDDGRRVIFISTDFPDVGDEVAKLIGSLGLAVVQLGRTDEGGRLIEVPNALVLRNLIERPLI
ncbi:MAG: NAD(P)-binding domain-containing protein [Jatrophihabitantaceae bacterium]